MGCKSSKAVNSTSKRTSWDKVDHRGVTIQVDRSIKTSDGGYVAAVFSANSGIVRNPAPVKSLEKNGPFPEQSSKGSYLQHEASMALERSNKQLPEKSFGDTVLGIPVLRTDQETRLVAAPKSRESMEENLETVNILELMEGLAEAEVSANFEQSHGQCEPSVPSTQKVERQGSLRDMPHTLDAQNAFSGKTTAGRPRPKSFSSFKSIEVVDRALSARRSKSPPPLNISSKAWPIADHGKRSNKESSHFLGTTHFQKVTSLRDSYGDTDNLTCETNFNAAGMTASCFDGKILRSPDHIKRTLSFKYMFKDNSSKEQGFSPPDLNPAACQINKGNAKFHRQDGLVLATARSWGESEGASAPLSPEFSPAVSLKDWLPSSNNPSNGPHLKGVLGPSIFDAFQLYTSEAGAPHHSTDSMKTQHMYPQGPCPSSHFLYQKGTIDVCMKIEGEDGVPFFDPEMVDTFENAMKNLSKEEWDAVRGMEDSPRNFLRLVKALKKSSSNSMRNQRALNIDQCELAEPLDMKLKKLSVEKKLAFMRQNSLEVKKALAKGEIKRSQERTGVVFYSCTTQMHAKIYEDCNQVRNILKSLVGVSYEERSISELREHEQELCDALNMSAVIVPTIYVKGKFLVGVDNILQLYRKGLLESMLQEEVPFESMNSVQCICRGGKFLVCPICKGKRNLSRVGEGTLLCRYCSGTGLIKCLSCSST